MKPESPINTIPFIVIALTVLIVGIEAVLQLAHYGIVGGARGVGWRHAAIEQYGFSGAVFELVFTRGNLSFDVLKRFITYPFVNGELTQVAFCAGLTLALGKFVGEFYGGLKVLVIYIVATICGALIYGLFTSGTYPLFGGFTPVYGLIGAFTYALWLKLGQTGQNKLAAFRLIGVLLGIQLLFGLFFGAAPSWVSELAGFVAGFAISVLLAPGGWRAFVNRMRQRA